jgi:two pore calcium channel protein 1
MSKSAQGKVDWGFLAIYILESILKNFGLGPTEYFKSGWNLFDFLVTLMALAGLVGSAYSNTSAIFAQLAIFRSLRLLR